MSLRRVRYCAMGRTSRRLTFTPIANICLWWRKNRTSYKVSRLPSPILSPSTLFSSFFPPPSYPTLLPPYPLPPTPLPSSLLPHQLSLSPLPFYLFLFFFLTLAGTIRDNILLGLDPDAITENQLHTACRDASIHDFVTSLPRASIPRLALTESSYSAYRGSVSVLPAHLFATLGSSCLMKPQAPSTPKARGSSKRLLNVRPKAGL